MPAQQGALAWQDNDPPRILVMSGNGRCAGKRQSFGHAAGLEAANHLDALMEHLARWLNGRAIFIVPNRRGFGRAATNPGLVRASFLIGNVNYCAHRLFRCGRAALFCRRTYRSV